MIDTTYFIRHDRVVPTLPPTVKMNPAKKLEKRTCSEEPTTHFLPPAPLLKQGPAFRPNHEVYGSLLFGKADNLIR